MTKIIRLAIYQATISIFQLDSNKDIIFETRTITATSEMHSSADSVMNMCEAQNKLNPYFNESVTVVQVFTNFLYEDGTLEYDTVEVIEASWNNLSESISLSKNRGNATFKFKINTF